MSIILVILNSNFQQGISKRIKDYVDLRMDRAAKDFGESFVYSINIMNQIHGPINRVLFPLGINFQEAGNIFPNN
jgi:hypothetical protein